MPTLPGTCAPPPVRAAPAAVPGSFASSGAGVGAGGACAGVCGAGIACTGGAAGGGFAEAAPLAEGALPTCCMPNRLRSPSHASCRACAPLVSFPSLRATLGQPDAPRETPVGCPDFGLIVLLCAVTGASSREHSRDTLVVLTVECFECWGAATALSFGVAPARGESRAAARGDGEESGCLRTPDTELAAPELAWPGAPRPGARALPGPA